MPNVYAISERYRKALAKREAKAVKRLVASYKTVFDALNAEMAGILAGAKANPSSVYRARRMAAFLAQAEAELSAVAPDAVAVVTAGQSQAVRDAVQAASEQLKATGVPIGAGIKAAGGIEGFADRAVAAYVGTAGNGSPLTELFAKLSTSGAQVAHDQMLTALTLGFGMDRTGEMLKNAIGISLTRAMTIARTEQMRAYRGARIGYLRENAEHVAGWVWHADRSWRTCPVCLALDGSFHELSEDFASHPACRCSPVSVAMGPDGKPELPERETGEQWFAKRSVEEQRMLLGPGKYALYKDGKIGLQDLVRVGKDPKWGTYRVERSLKDVEAGLGGGGSPPAGPPSPPSTGPGSAPEPIGRPKTTEEAHSKIDEIITGFDDSDVGREIADRARRLEAERSEWLDRWLKAATIDPYSDETRIARAERDRCGALLGKIEDERKRVLNQRVLEDVVYVDNPSTCKVNLVGNMTDQHRKLIEDGHAHFSRMLGRTSLDGMEIEVECKPLGPGEAGHYLPFLKRIEMTDNGMFDEIHVTHETGHWLEDIDASVHTQAVDFLRKRAGNATPTSSLGHNGATGWWGMFPTDDYMGRIYGDVSDITATEVISGGLEGICRDPITLYDKDRELFDFLFDLLRGNT